MWGNEKCDNNTDDDDANGHDPHVSAMLRRRHTHKKNRMWEHNHYENMPIQIHWKFYHQKMKIFR